MVEVADAESRRGHHSVWWNRCVLPRHNNEGLGVFLLKPEWANLSSCEQAPVAPGYYLNGRLHGDADCFACSTSPTSSLLLCWLWSSIQTVKRPRDEPKPFFFFFTHETLQLVLKRRTQQLMNDKCSRNLEEPDKSVSRSAVDCVVWQTMAG